MADRPLAVWREELGMWMVTRGLLVLRVTETRAGAYALLAAFLTMVGEERKKRENDGS